jgi:hypothetical protein
MRRKIACVALRFQYVRHGGCSCTRTQRRKICMSSLVSLHPCEAAGPRAQARDLRPRERSRLCRRRSRRGRRCGGGGNSSAAGGIVPGPVLALARRAAVAGEAAGRAGAKACGGGGAAGVAATVAGGDVRRARRGQPVQRPRWSGQLAAARCDAARRAGRPPCRTARISVRDRFAARSPGAGYRYRARWGARMQGEDTSRCAFDDGAFAALSLLLLSLLCFCCFCFRCAFAAAGCRCAPFAAAGCRCARLRSAVALRAFAAYTRSRSGRRLGTSRPTRTTPGRSGRGGCGN